MARNGTKKKSTVCTGSRWPMVPSQTQIVHSGLETAIVAPKATRTNHSDFFDNQLGQEQPTHRLVHGLPHEFTKLWAAQNRRLFLLHIIVILI
mmetsp:Transcript_7996/g.19294  ORF Transcript_7996/g.19294 Transcript_7996/m.19294 type:complete len:93 (+) Transcript_7996:214-492(+)